MAGLRASGMRGTMWWELWGRCACEAQCAAHVMRRQCAARTACGRQAGACCIAPGTLRAACIAVARLTLSFACLMGKLCATTEWMSCRLCVTMQVVPLPFIHPIYPWCVCTCTCPAGADAHGLWVQQQSRPDELHLTLLACQ
jgi:hypothetical protein